MVVCINNLVAISYVFLVASGAQAAELLVAPYVTQGVIKHDDKSHKPLTGVVLTFYENGQLRQKVKYMGGQENGISELYRENGILKRKLSYRDGKQHGLMESYYESGLLKIKSNFKSGNPQGLYELFHKKMVSYAQKYTTRMERNKVLRCRITKMVSCN